MAKRPVFFVKTDSPFYQEELVPFQYNAGFSEVQKRKNIQAIHEAFCANHHNARPLEISSKSNVLVGKQLSAFNLLINLGETDATVESAFQSGKVFKNGGPYTDLLSAPSYYAKKDPRLQNSGPLQSFCFNGITFPTEPKTFFYDWLYITAVSENTGLAKELCQYNAFTDIEFNPNRSINCQARSAAIFVSVAKQGLLDAILESPEQFRQIVYGNEPTDKDQQLSLF